MNAAEKIVDHALGLEWRALPAETRHAARRLLHDTLCVGAAGAGAANADAVVRVASGWGGGGNSAVLGRPAFLLPAPQAAFVNAFQIHAQEFDAVHEGAVLHPLSTTVAALMAEVGRSGPYAGGDVLAAMVAGVDVAVVLGLADPSPLRFFRPAVAGIFGAVAALTRLRRTSRLVARDALGYALAFTSGTMQAHVEGKPALALQVANAARGAIAAVDIAQAGIAGPAHSVDGPFGYFNLYTAATDATPVIDTLGKVFRIGEVSSKPFPTGRAAHGGIAATQALMRDHGVSAENLQKLTYRAPPLIHRLVGRPATAGMDIGYARLCLPWLAAVTLKTGTVSLYSFDRHLLHDVKTLSLASRISVEEIPSSDLAAFVPAEAIATFIQGGTASTLVNRLLGSPANPLNDDQHLEKARACLKFAGLEHSHGALVEAIESDDAQSAFNLAAGGA